ncbi:hypothetical protein [Streptomyces jeddahensis]|uniref:Uncharacterized protein n=1 Tax=Streptomyces jeddahensis TaxID=1716141 RepID=A0A177HJ39_9ACTN|nr:hypothetical protein [Streptomyces jeddahensis]OAH10983.1 hypothetical protein STSP_58250 [Streptomyces jeddahensis]
MSQRTAPAPGTDDAHELLEFTGDITDYWSYTQVRDWVLLQPDLTRTALHLYLLLRSMVSESVRRNGGALRRMSIDQLCWLLPGVNGKPASLTMVKDALRLLAAHNLVVNPDGGRLVTSGGKNAIQNTFRTYKVNDLPPDAYEGWRNVWDKLDAYTPDWRDNPPQPPLHTRTDAGVRQSPSGAQRISDAGVRQPSSDARRISDHRNDQARSEVAAARFDGRKSDRTGRKSDRTRRKSVAAKPVTSGNAVPKEVFQRSLSLSPPEPVAPQDTSVPDEVPTEERETDAAPPLSEDAVAVAETFAEQWKAERGTRPGRRQVQAVAADAAEAIEDGDAVDWLLHGVVPFMVRNNYLDFGRAKTHPQCPPPKGAKVPVPGQRPGVPNWCGECNDGIPPEILGERFRKTSGGRLIKCPECHPGAVKQRAAV